MARPLAAVSWWLYVQTYGGAIGHERVACAVAVPGTTAYVYLTEAVFVGKGRPELDRTRRCDADLATMGYLSIPEQTAHILCPELTGLVRALRGED